MNSNVQLSAAFADYGLMPASDRQSTWKLHQRNGVLPALLLLVNQIPALARTTHFTIPTLSQAGKLKNNWHHLAFDILGYRSISFDSSFATFS